MQGEGKWLADKRKKTPEKEKEHIAKAERESSIIGRSLAENNSVEMKPRRNRLAV